DLRRNADLVSTEVDDPVAPAVSAATEPDGDPALVVAAGRDLLRLREPLLGRFLRELAEVRHLEVASARARRLELLHGSALLEELDRLALGYVDDRLLPVLGLGVATTHPTNPSAHDHRVH